MDVRLQSRIKSLIHAMAFILCAAQAHADLSLVPADGLDFGVVRTGQVADKVVTLTNTGDTSVTLGNITGYAAPFSLADDCPAVLPAHASCVLVAGFAPTGADTASGGMAAPVKVSTNIQIGGLTYMLQGIAADSGNTGAVLALSPAGPIDFGSVKVGDTLTRAVTLSNSGTGYATLGDLPGLPEPFSLSNGCPTILRAGTSCVLTVGFTPRASDVASGNSSSITVSTPANVAVAGTPYTFIGKAIASTSVAAPILVLSPPGPYSFGNVLAGQTAVKVLQLSNTGNSEARIGSLAGLAAPFAVKSNCLGTLAAGSSCTLAVTYSPAATDSGGASASLLINANVSVNGTPYAFTASSAAAGVAGLALSPAGPYNFGPVKVGDTSSTLLVLRNSGSLPATVSSIAALAAPFSITQNCLKTLAPGDNCVLLVKYSPTAADLANGASSRAQILIGAAPPAIGVPYDLIGTAQSGSPSLSLAPAGPASFGAVAVGQSAIRLFNLVNSGSGAAEIKPVTLSAPYALTTNCGTLLVARASCQYSVQYKPSAAELLAGSSPKGQLQIDASAPVSGSPLDLSGTPAPGAAALTLTPAGPFAFGSVKVGEIGNRVILLSNTGGSPAALSGFSGISQPYSLKHNCPGSLDAGKNCQISVSYTPTAADLGAVSASAQLKILAGVEVSGSPYGFTATPRAADPLAPILSLSPGGPYSFGAIDAGSVSTTSLTLSNTGNAPAQLSGFTGLRTPFSSTDNCPTFLQAGEKCTVKVRFAPINMDASTGTASSELNVVANVPVSGAPFAISGSANASATVEKPAAFSFDAVKGVALASTVQSNMATLTGFTKTVLVQISNGQYSLNGLPFTSDAGAARPGDTVQVRLTSANDYNLPVTATLIVGGVSANFAASTLAKSFSVTGNGLSSSNVVVQPSGATQTQSLNVQVTLADVAASTLAAPVRDGHFADAGDVKYKVFVAGLVPSGVLGLTAPAIYMKDITANWVLPGSPLAAYLENVLLYSQDTAIKIDILSEFDFGLIPGTEFFIGYGTSDMEMLNAGRYRAFYKVP